MTPSTRTAAISAILFSLVGLVGASCSDNKADSSAPPPGGAALVSVEYGRLVDIYAYRRIDPARSDRRDVRNRQPVLIARDQLVRPDIENVGLFDVEGNARPDAQFRYLPFDVGVGHEELLILFDDQVPPERAQFEVAMTQATTGLPRVTDSFREQNINERPIPVIPRNAAIRLRFDRDLGVGADFFAANPAAIQVLEFITPRGGFESFRPVPVRLLPGLDTIVLDTSLVGGEAQGGRNTAGLPESLDNRVANLRIALPTNGPIAGLLEFEEDGVPELNGRGASGEPAVIRDFRSGNVRDGAVGALADVERPMIVKELKMGITSIDFANRVVTVNKRNLDAPIRGRIPYVDGALDPATGFAGGPGHLPTEFPLRSGDILSQTVVTPAGESVRVRAEVVMNLEVGNVLGDPEFVGVGMHRVGRDPNEPADGGQEVFARLQVTSLTATDSSGEPVNFESNSLPDGKDCELRVHYYHHVKYRAAYAGALTEVSDADRAVVFLNIDPEPPVLGPNRQVAFGTNVDPMATIGIRFSEPMNLAGVENYENMMLTNDFIPGDEVAGLLDDHKAIALSVLTSSLLDAAGDGTLLQLRTPLGHFHNKDGTEKYWCHVLLGGRAPVDMAGNIVDAFNRQLDPLESFSVPYVMRKDAEVNAVGYRTIRAASLDEDGTILGSPDMFGQFQLLDGEIRALPTVRFSEVADGASLGTITRFQRGECDVGGAFGPPLIPVLYSCPSEVANGVTEPHNPRGSRLQLTYREEDFNLGFRDPNRHLVDVEQLFWAPFNDAAVLFDVFDRYTLRLAHSDWRPDFTNTVGPGGCGADCFTGRSGLRTRFDDNLLEGTTYETVVKDQTYEVNPNDAFRTQTNTKMVPYPRFQQSYTWRDPRLIRWDDVAQSATGFGGAHEPNASSLTQRDTTASVSSPYVPDLPRAPYAPLHAGTGFVLDYGDFLGFRARDHSPIALPLLVDFSIYPDGSANGGRARGTNQFHIAEVGPCFPLPGYYSTGPMCTGGIPFPQTRAHISGGIDLITGDDILVDPDVEEFAAASVITDALLGTGPRLLFTAPPLDDHVPWAQADFLRRVSMVTFGFFDAERPNRHDFANGYQTTWAGRNDPIGLPNLTGFGGRIVDLVSVMDPPLSQQPVGTSVVLEFRGAAGFDNAETLFRGPDDLTRISTLPGGPLASQQVVALRGNLLNPYYACEAFRYARATDVFPAYHVVHSVGFDGAPRVEVDGLTSYVTEDRLDAIRDGSGLLPRFLNFRLIMENNVEANPPLSPRIKSLGIAYRMSPAQ